MDLDSEYYLLLIDIIDSTQLTNKGFGSKMELLETQLINTNNNFRNDLVLPLSISYGDEIAGLFNTPENIFSIVAEIRKIFYPVTTIRFVVVRGTIARVSSDIRKIGGIAFKKANKTIEVLKKNNRFCSWQIDDQATDKALESLCEMSDVIIKDMSNYQREIFGLLREGISQKQIADKLGKYTQSIWDSIQRSKAIYVIEAEQTVNLILKEYQPKQI